MEHGLKCVIVMLTQFREKITCTLLPLHTQRHQRNILCSPNSLFDEEVQLCILPIIFWCF